ncbi:MAG: helix-turn-helix domain-containing protein [Richelia sp. RM2_1_2]|nr:helix-turn-helix domain-containing protein [Richelia sp. SM2_1_7]NJO63113.1 helix-turn-helix domain-containing protein [Richelia sp. RM2_1_2]
MPKHSHKQRESGKSSAFQLLDKGFPPKEVATTLNVSLRTLQRWIKQENYQCPSDRTNSALVEVTNRPIEIDFDRVETVGVEATGELQEYYESQRMLAIQMGELTRLLTPKVKAVIELSNPADIPIRSIPSLTKAITDLANASSDCWARATGLEEVLNVIQTISTRQAQAGTASPHNSSAK